MNKKHETGKMAKDPWQRNRTDGIGKRTKEKGKITKVTGQMSKDKEQTKMDKEQRTKNNDMGTCICLRHLR